MKSFSLIFLKKWIVLLVIAFSFSVIETYSVPNHRYEEVYHEQLADMEYGKANIHVLLDELCIAPVSEKTDLEKMLQYEVEMYESVLYDAKFEVYPADIGKSVLIKEIGLTNQSVFYSCPIEYFESLPISIDYYYEVEDFYVNDTQFLPGKLSYCHKDDFDKIQEINLTPVNTEGYIYIDAAGHTDKYFEMSSYSFKPSIPKDILSEFQNYESEGNRDEEMTINRGGFWNRKCYTCIPFTVSDGSQYYYISEYEVHLWELCETELILLYIVSLFLGTLIAVIWGAINYKHDVLLSYQKNLTKVLAHDLKSPLMVVSGYAQNLSERTCPEKDEHNANAIVENVDDMSQLINDILLLSRLQEQRIVLKRAKQSVYSLIQENIRLYIEILNQRRQEIVVTGDTTINCDAMLMKRVFDNLISNAIYHSEEGSKITIEISEKKLVISNPVSEEMSNKKEQLLEPFEKGDESRKQPHGTGIGLSIAKSILKMHKYSIKIEYKEKTFVAILVFGKKKF